METDPPLPPPPLSSSEKEAPSQGTQGAQETTPTPVGSESTAVSEQLSGTAASGGPPGVEAMEQEVCVCVGGGVQ